MECWNNGIMNKKEKVSNPNIPSFQYSIVPKVALLKSCYFHPDKRHFVYVVLQ